MDDISKNGAQNLYNQLCKIDPISADRIHINDQKRIVRALEVYNITGKPISSFQKQFRSGNYIHKWRIIGLQRAKDDVSSRINRRVTKMVDDGLVDEVKSLVNEPDGLSMQAAQAVGYAEVIDYFDNKYTHDQAIEKIKINTRRFAKSQRTWYRGFNNVNWYDLSPNDTVEAVCDRVIQDIK